VSIPLPSYRVTVSVRQSASITARGKHTILALPDPFSVCRMCCRRGFRPSTIVQAPLQRDYRASVRRRFLRVSMQFLNSVSCRQ